VSELIASRAPRQTFVAGRWRHSYPQQRLASIGLLVTYPTHIHNFFSSQNIYTAYTDLGHLGIEHGDVRHSNILRVLDSTGQSNLKSPFSNQSYDFRLVGFEKARKTNGTIMATGLTHASWLEKMINDLPAGIVSGQWEGE
jgi:hypothetical protein